MSLAVSLFVWKNSKSKLGGRLVLLYLAERAHDDGSNIYPSVATIAQNTNLSTRQVKRHLKTLVNSGELVEVGVSGLSTRQFRIPITEGGDISGREGVTFQAKTPTQNVTQSVIRKPLDQTSDRVTNLMIQMRTPIGFKRFSPSGKCYVMGNDQRWQRFAAGDVERPAPISAEA